MTNADKKALLVGGATILVMVALFFFRDKSVNTIYQSSNGDILIPAVGAQTLPTFERATYVIPGLNNSGQTESLSAIGACCSDCSQKTTVREYVPSVNPLTIVFNEGNKGPNVYNYTQQAIVPYRPPYAY